MTDIHFIKAPIRPLIILRFPLFPLVGTKTDGQCLMDCTSRDEAEKIHTNLIYGRHYDHIKPFEDIGKQLNRKWKKNAGSVFGTWQPYECH